MARHLADLLPSLASLTSFHLAAGASLEDQGEGDCALLFTGHSYRTRPSVELASGAQGWLTEPLLSQGEVFGGVLGVQ